MDITPKSTKIMTKEETALLMDLIQSNPILTSKVTNATTNKVKEDTWTALVTSFNAKSGSIPRTKEQLKSKWDNLKKAARKRSHLIRMNNLKTGCGKPDIIPVDEVLEKVSSLLGGGSLSASNFFGMPVSNELRTIRKGKRKADNDGRRARNLAIARYYNKKTEKVDLEVKILRLQLDKENKNNVSNDG